MEITEGLKHRGRPFEIPDCSRDDFPGFFKKSGFKVGVEIGVYKGHYTRKLAKSGLQIYGVDPWRPYPGFDRMEDGRVERQEELYERSRKFLSGCENVTLLRKTSMEALEDFEDDSLDFVYIDGNHRFTYMAEDIFRWSYKIKRGGFICGHDYATFKHREVGCGCQVKEIVDAFSTSFELDFWLLGRKKRKGKEKRDRYRSWMFIKEWENQ